MIVVVGNDPHINGRETEDRTTLDLPAHQARLWRAAHAANPRTVLAVTSAYPYALTDAAAALPALLWTAHGGQAAGTALARILSGDVSPAGRLPQTWYTSDAELPGLLDYDIIGSRQTYLYYQGTPLYPFGHGLSYTAFSYSGLTAERDGDRLNVSVNVTNTGVVAADEVAQLYVRAQEPSVVRPLRQLVGHRRLHLAPGAGQRIEFAVPVTELGHWDVAHSRWTVEPGGTKSRPEPPPRTSGSPPPSRSTANRPAPALSCTTDSRRPTTTSSSAPRSSTARRRTATPSPPPPP